MKIVAILGTYNKTGMIDSAVDEILAAAAREGSEVRKIHLLDAHIEFCRNCQSCVQEKGTARGKCPIPDDMSGILDEIEAADALVLASPMNFWTVTALMKRFIERLICYGYWPWGSHAPKDRSKPGRKRAIVVASSACPAPIARLLTGMTKLLRISAKLMGFGQVDTLFIGLARHTPTSSLSGRARAKAAKLGRRLRGAV